MVQVGLLARVVAKPGKEKAVEQFLKDAVKLARAEAQTVDWYAIKLADDTFGIFDTFAGDEGRQAHLSGEIAKALMQHAPDLLAQDPVIEQVEILAVK
jgi:quinol monooxygenase YgiN